MADNGTSKAFSLDLTDVKKVVLNAALVAASAGLTYLANNAGNLNLGPSAAFVVPMIVVVLQTSARWVQDYTKNTK